MKHKLDRDKIFKKCEQKLKQLQDQYNSTLSRPQDNESPGGEIIDIAFREQHLQHSQYFRDRIQALLPEVQNALERIKEGTYGLCLMTGEEIEAKRLIAVPWTQISIRAIRQEAG